jgi:hypothetical protein
MIARRHRSQTRPPRGAWLAFLAIAMQVLLPFLLAAEIARADEPGSVAVICSALGPVAHHDSGTKDGDNHGLTTSCPICTTLSAAHGFTPPPAAPLPLPVACASIDLSAAVIVTFAVVSTFSYQSRGPPPIA